MLTPFSVARGFKLTGASKRTREQYHDLNSEKENIYHAEIRIGNQRIMMCDNFDVPYQPSGSLSLTVTMDTKEEVMRAFDKMKEGSKIVYPIQSTAYSSCFVSFYDKFGFRWVIMTEQAGK